LRPLDFFFLPRLSLAAALSAWSAVKNPSTAAAIPPRKRRRDGLSRNERITASNRDTYISDYTP
jgi:hypothetical protein